MKWALLTSGKLFPHLDSWFHLPPSPHTLGLVSTFCAGPYMEMMHFMWAPKFDDATATYVFSVPLGDGAIPMIHLDDRGEYARWVFDHPDQSAGMNLEIATQHVHFDEVARAFTNVTGKKAIYKEVALQSWLEAYSKEGASSAYQVDASESGVLTWRESFTGWWNCWRHSGGENPVISRDYKLLDKV